MLQYTYPGLHAGFNLACRLCSPHGHDLQALPGRQRGTIQSEVASLNDWHRKLGLHLYTLPCQGNVSLALHMCTMSS